MEAGGVDLTVDLEAQTIAGARGAIRFEIDPAARMRLLNGWDDIQMTLSYADRIAAFQAHDQNVRPWAASRAD